MNDTNGISGMNDTNGMSEGATAGKAKTLAKRFMELFDYTVKSDYDVTIRSYPNKNSTEAECCHHLKGNMTHDVVKIMGIAAVCAGAMALMCAVCCRMFGGMAD